MKKPGQTTISAFPSTPLPLIAPHFSDPFSHNLNVNPITADVLLLCSLQMVRTILACRPDESIQLTDEFVSGAKR